MDFAAQAVERLEELGKISDEPGRLTRLFAGPGMRRANELAGSWMKQAGMTVRQDAIGNLIGRFPGAGAKTLLLGSHLDTVREAGKFDGALGVVLAIACVERCRHAQRTLPFSIEVIAFADEEGVRYRTGYLGSRAVTTKYFDPEDLQILDDDGVTLFNAIRAFGGDPERLESCRFAPEHLLGYVEAHIEQGPILEQRNQAVGLVSAIAGQTRGRVKFIGKAGHAGTVPMNLRQDALCAASEFILEVEKTAREMPGLVATVGQISCIAGKGSSKPNASNVIPSDVMLSFDIRHAQDEPRQRACSLLQQAMERIGLQRHVKPSWHAIQNTASVPCSPEFTALLREAALKHQPEIIALPSGAGHDAAIMARLTPAAMLFVRCREGISHHPDESVRPDDIGVALEVLFDFVSLLAQRHEQL
jgi:allantoate deiminase